MARCGCPLLWEHGETARGEKPIGRVPRLWRKPDVIIAEIEFDHSDEFAMQLYRDYADGRLSDFSIAWLSRGSEIADGVRTASHWTLIEISAVEKGRNLACRATK